MKASKYLIASLFGITTLFYQNCGQVKFAKKAATTNTNNIPADCTAGGVDGTAICGEKTLYFIGGVGQVFGDSSNAEDGSGEIILNHPFNGKNARVKIYKDENGNIEVRPAAGYYPWACLDHTKEIGALLQHKNSDGSPGIAVSNCYSPIRWYTDDGQQGFAKDTYNSAAGIQKNSKEEVYRRATPSESGIYVTNMILAPPDRVGKNLIWVHNPSPRPDFMTYYTTLYDGVFPYPESSTHLKAYEYKYDPNNGSAWTDLLIENNPQQLSQAASEGYFP